MAFDSRAQIPAATTQGYFETFDGLAPPPGTPGFLTVALDGGGISRILRAGVLGVTAAPIGYQNSLPMGRFLSAPPALADGDLQHLMLDAAGNLRVTGSVTTAPSVVGAHGNAWNAALTGVATPSAVVDCQFAPFLTIFGNVSASTKITVELSQDNANFYGGTTSNVPAGGDFQIFLTSGARYVRLKSSINVMATVTIAGKD